MVIIGVRLLQLDLLDKLQAKAVSALGVREFSRNSHVLVAEEMRKESLPTVAEIGRDENLGAGQSAPATSTLSRIYLTMS